ncbi:Hypothetical protein POVN_LOCUS472 [uncultured virus]|nr:Hypothetical protein POVN_LOCUS472 [uncultured virus]
MTDVLITGVTGLVGPAGETGVTGGPSYTEAELIRLIRRGTNLTHVPSYLFTPQVVIAAIETGGQLSGIPDTSITEEVLMATMKHSGFMNGFPRSAVTMRVMQAAERGGYKVDLRDRTLYKKPTPPSQTWSTIGLVAAAMAGLLYLLKK